MSIQALAYASSLRVAPNGLALTGAERLIVFVLADYHSHHGENWAPTIERLADDAVMTESQVCKVLKSLKDNGILHHDLPIRFTKEFA